VIRIRNQQDLAAGLFLIAVAMVARYFAADLAMGRLVRMGPGYLPTVLSWILAGLGVLIAARGFLTDGPRLESWAWRPLLALLGALVAFGLLLQDAGLAIAIIVTTGISSLAARGADVVTVLILGIALAALSTVLFIWLLGLPLTIWPDWG
jgi:putative tricarboxylic transport membrane protein